MPLFQTTIKSEYNTNDDEARLSFMENLAEFITETTETDMTFSQATTDLAGYTSFDVNISVEGLAVNGFLLTISTVAGSGLYLSKYKVNTSLAAQHTLNQYVSPASTSATLHNTFSAAAYYRAKVVVIKSDDLFYVGLNCGESAKYSYQTVFLIHKAKNLNSENDERWFAADRYSESYTDTAANIQSIFTTPPNSRSSPFYSDVRKIKLYPKTNVLGYESKALCAYCVPYPCTVAEHTPFKIKDGDKVYNAFLAVYGAGSTSEIIILYD